MQLKLVVRVKKPKNLQFHEQGIENLYSASGKQSLCPGSQAFWKVIAEQLHYSGYRAVIDGQYLFRVLC